MNVRAKKWILLRTSVSLALLVASAPKVLSLDDRDALWRVDQACSLNHALTGAAFPCLDVNVSDGVERGYVILKPPFGNEHFVLAPTRKIVGVEDPSLRADDAPNYFEAAWNARAFLADSTHAQPARDTIALAVNSNLTRTQDQLHIHIGCISQQVMRSFQANEPELSQPGWHRLRRSIGGLMFWALPIDQETLANVNPFRLAFEAQPVDIKDVGRVTIVVAGSRSAEGRDGFILLTTINDPLRSGFRSSGSDLLAHYCPP